MIHVSRREILRGTAGAAAVGVLPTAAAFRASPALADTASEVPTSAAPLVGIARTPSSRGYWQVASDGGVFSFGDAGFHGSMSGKHLNMPVVGIAATPGGKGYWLAAADGGVFSFGNADFHGSLGSRRLDSPIVGIASTPSGDGYWLAAADGGIFAFGDAKFRGSMARHPLNASVTGISAAPAGQGYWEVAGDGGVFTFGALDFHGSLGGQPPKDPVTAMAATPSGAGYWLVTIAGEVFTFGDAQPADAASGSAPTGGVNAICRTSSGDGYWLSTVDGRVYAFGDATSAGHVRYRARSSAASTRGRRSSTRGRRAAALALGWVGLDYRGAGGERWGVPGPPELWCADFVTYTWQRAGIDIDRIAWVASLAAWGRKHQRWSTDLSALAPGDAVIYSHHTGLVVDVQPNDVVVTADGDWGGTGRTNREFARSSRVRLNVWQPSTGRGSGKKTILGFVRAV